MTSRNTLMAPGKDSINIITISWMPAFKSLTILCFWRLRTKCGKVKLIIGFQMAPISIMKANPITGGKRSSMTRMVLLLNIIKENQLRLVDMVWWYMSLAIMRAILLIIMQRPKFAIMAIIGRYRLQNKTLWKGCSRLLPLGQPFSMAVWPMLVDVMMLMRLV